MGERYKETGRKSSKSSKYKREKKSSKSKKDKIHKNRDSDRYHRSSSKKVSTYQAFLIVVYFSTLIQTINHTL